jgi:IS30 family transposase
MKYRQLTEAERTVIASMRAHRTSCAEIARHLDRHPSTISREVARNAAPHDGFYRVAKAVHKASARRRRSRKGTQFSPEQLRHVERMLTRKFSPEQIAGTVWNEHRFAISFSTIYRHVRRDRKRGGTLFTHLRHGRKFARKRYRSIDSRGVLRGKRAIDERPSHIELRKQFGHWEIDTVMGPVSSKPCVLTLVERKTGYIVIGKLANKTSEETNRVMTKLINRAPDDFRTLTADNGTEFHGYEVVEHQTGVTFYFAKPYCSWERASNENANGLLRQYLPKGQPMSRLTQADCDAIARQLNNRPRKRHGFRTPAQQRDRELRAVHFK